MSNEVKKPREFWHDGCPDPIYASEWFIARLDNGDKVLMNYYRGNN